MRLLLFVAVMRMPQKYSYSVVAEIKNRLRRHPEGIRLYLKIKKLGFNNLTFLILFGGAGRDRTDGLMNAIHALSQLSYSPTN